MLQLSCYRKKPRIYPTSIVASKRLHLFEANLVKRSNKFHQNRRSFIEDITKKHFGLFFLDTLYVVTNNDIISVQSLTTF